MKDPSTHQNTDLTSLDVYGDAKKIVRILNRFIVLTLTGIGVGLIVQLARNDVFGATLRVVYMILILASLYYVRRSQIELATTFLAFVLITLITTVSTYGKGIYQISMIAYPPVLIFASLVIRKQIMALLIAYNVACVAWLVFGDIHGLYTPDIPSQASIADFLILTLVIVFTAFMVRALTEALFQNNLLLNRELQERKRIEEQREALIRELEARNTELTQFTYTVSHDLKSPLVTIKGFLGFLEADAASGNFDRMKLDAERIAGAVEKMQKLLNDLLELSRIGRLVNPSEKIPFEEIVREAMELVTPDKLNKSQVAFELEQNLPSVYGDKQRLIEVLQNLMDNAIKFMGDQPDPQVEIGQFGEENGNPIFFVRDNGIGIAREYHEQVFGIFNRLNPQIDGTGVGLALVRRIIEFHGGRIWLKSEPQQGSTFYFILPRG